MRQPEDNRTPELPGIPPLPPVPFEKLRQAERRQLMGFKGPKERPCCKNCRHSQLFVQRPDSFDEGATLKCRPGAFPVQAGACCDRWRA